MKICPECKYEYRDEITTCPDCGQNLVGKEEYQNLPDNNKDSDEQLILIERVWQLPMAELIKEILEENGIPCMLQGTYLKNKVVQGAIDDIKIFVPSSKAETAKELIDIFLDQSNETPDKIKCPNCGEMIESYRIQCPKCKQIISD